MFGISYQKKDKPIRKWGRVAKYNLIKRIKEISR